MALLLTVDLDPGRAQSASTDDVKAAYLFNFAKFVEWPDAADDGDEPLVLAVMGSDAIADSLTQITKGKTAGGRPLAPRRVATSGDVSQVHLLFIGAAAGDRLADVMRRVGNDPVLTVSDLDRFCQLGGVIGLTLEDRNVRFEVNLEAAERSRLKVSSKLLTLARSVFPARPGERR